MYIRLVVLLDEKILFVDDGEIRQYLDSLVPSRMYRFIFRTGNGEQFRQFYRESDRNIRIFGHDAAVFHRQKRELPPLMYFSFFLAFIGK